MHAFPMPYPSPKVASARAAADFASQAVADAAPESVVAAPRRLPPECGPGLPRIEGEHRAGAFALARRAALVCGGGAGVVARGTGGRVR